MNAQVDTKRCREIKGTMNMSAHKRRKVLWNFGAQETERGKL